MRLRGRAISTGLDPRLEDVRGQHRCVRSSTGCDGRRLYFAVELPTANMPTPPWRRQSRFLAHRHQYGTGPALETHSLADSVGANRPVLGSVTPDGKSYAIDYTRHLDQLYLAAGIR